MTQNILTYLVVTGTLLYILNKIIRTFISHLSGKEIGCTDCHCGSSKKLDVKPVNLRSRGTDIFP